MGQLKITLRSYEELIHLEAVLESFKSVVFRIGGEEFGLPIQQVLSIERIQSITAVPRMPKYVIGVIDMRGIVTPIIDLRKALLDREVQEKDTTRIIVVNVQDNPIGLVVDAATDVLDIPPDSIQPPNVSGDQTESYLMGIAKLDTRLLILINIDNLLQNIATLDELKHVKKIYQQAE